MDQVGMGQTTPLQEIVSAGYSIDAGALVSGSTAYTASSSPGNSQIPITDGSGNITLTGNLNVGAGKSVTSSAALTVTSGGSSALTLTSKSGTLDLGTGTNTIANTDASTALTLNPTGNIDFFSASNSITSAGNLTLAGSITSNGTTANTFSSDINQNNGNDTISPITAPTTAPTLSVTNGGHSLAAGTWYGKYTWYNSDGETTASSESTQATTTGGASEITFTIPTIPAGATGAKLYLTPVNGASGSEVYQNVTITSGTTGVVTSYNAGAAYPTVNTAGGSIIANGNANTLNNTTINGSTTLNGGTSSTANTIINNSNFTVNGVTSPTTTATLGSNATGSLGATTYYVEYTWVNADGETYLSSESSLAVSASHVLTVTVPSFPASVTSANVYVSNTAGGGSGAETKQTSITTSGGTWTEPTSGLVAGALPPPDDAAGGLIQTTGFINVDGPFSTNWSGLYLDNTNTSSLTTPPIDFASGGTTQRLLATTVGTNPTFEFLNKSVTSAVDSFDNNGQIIVNAPSAYSGNLINLEVNGTSEFSVDSNGHIISTGATPTIVAGSGAGSELGGADSVTGTDEAGVITMYTGTGTVANQPIAVLTFAHAYTNQIYVLTQAAVSNNCTANYVEGNGTGGQGGFNYYCSSTPTANATWTIVYWVVQ